MENFNFPVVFTLNAKRGGSYKERKIEIYKDLIKYFELSKFELYTS